MLTNRRIVAGLATLIVLVAGSSFADPQYKIGLKGGVNQSKLRGNQVSGYVSGDIGELAGAIDHYETGGQFGVFIRRHMKDSFSMQLELQFVQKGGNGVAHGVIDVSEPNNAARSGEFNGEVTANLDYVEVPVMAVFDFESDDRVDLIFEGGLVLAFNTKAEVGLAGTAEVERVDFSKASVDVDQREDVTSRVNPVDFLGALGMGFEIEMSSYDLLINGRYTFGFTTIDASGSSSVWNNTFSLTAGLAFGVGE